MREKNISFTKVVLVCCWTLGETEHIAMGHQMTMNLELLLGSWLTGPIKSENNDNLLFNGTGTCDLGLITFRGQMLVE